MQYPYSMWLGWVNWFIAKHATGLTSGVACSVRPQLCNMYIALTTGILVIITSVMQGIFGASLTSQCIEHGVFQSILI